MSYSLDNTVHVYGSPCPTRQWSICARADWWGSQQHTWAPGRQHSTSAPQSFSQGEEMVSVAQGAMAIRDHVAPLIFPGAKSTLLASSLVKVSWT